MRAVLVVNPKATATTAAGRDVLAHALASEVKLEVLETDYRGHAMAAATRAAVDGADLVRLLVVGADLELRRLDRRHLERPHVVGPDADELMAAAGVSLLVFNLVFGTEINGAKNWIYIGPFSFQPSELVKLCFVFAGASTLDRMVSRRNLWLFIAYTGVCCGCLALMNDFGTAMIFFLAFVIVALMRSGSFATIALICAGTGLAGGLAVRFRPYVMRRFSAWRHVWEYALEGGYQQTRALMCIASGGLFGLGLGNGWL